MHRQDKLAMQLMQKDNQELWATKYFPTDLNDIPLYKKSQTTNFMTRLKDAFQGYPYYPRVIIISGPVGCGKSTLVQAVCNYNHYQIISFSPDDDYYQTEEDSIGAPQVPIFVKQFEAFLEHSQLVTSPNNLHVLLIDNIVVEDDSKKYFVNLIEKYSTDKRRLFPLIWIVDSSNSSISPNNCMTFNYPAASHSVLKRVLLRVSRSEGIKLTNQQIEDMLCDNPGDVRLAVNTLQFSRTFTTGQYDSLTFFQAVGEVCTLRINGRQSKSFKSHIALLARWSTLSMRTPSPFTSL